MLDSRLRRSILNTLMILGLSVLIVVIFYFLDLWFLGLYQNYIGVPFSPLTDLFFIQGVMLIMLGFTALLFTMKNMWGNFYGTRVANDDPRFGLTLACSGATMIFIYFLYF